LSLLAVEKPDNVIVGTELRWDRIEAVGVSAASRRSSGHRGGTHQCKQTDQGSKNELAVMDGLRGFFEERIVRWLMILEA
jgi:hypothetical protein